MHKEEILKGINHLKKNDEFLAKIISLSSTCSLKPKRDHYLVFLQSIINQQLSVTAGASIYKRFLLFFENNPAPEKILKTSDETLRGLGISWSKIKYIKDFAEKILTKELHFRNLNRKTDDQIIADFIKVKGIGRWTVQMFLIFTLARLNVLPVNDLGLKKGAMIVYDLRKLPDEKKLFSLSKKFNWSPYNSIASWYLWRSLELNKNLLNL